MAIGLPSWVIKAIDKKRRAFLWMGTDSANGGQCRVSWTRVCRPRDLGGLGIPDLRVAGFALRVRWLWLQRSGHPYWSDLKAPVEQSVSDMFAASTFSILGDGQSTLFWTDRWIDGRSIASIDPDLLHVVPPRFRGSRTVAAGLANNSWVGDIRGALTVPVISQFLLVWDAVVPTQLSPGVEDHLVWRWTGDQCYSARSAYQAFFLGQHSFACADLLWHAKGPAKCKFVLWFAFQKRCWTADLLQKRGIDSHSACPFCAQELETANHILIDCVFARQVWLRVLSPPGWAALSPSRGSWLQDWWSSSRVCLPEYLHSGFDSLVLLVSWQLWKERNSRVFDSALASVTVVLESIRSEGQLWSLVGVAFFWDFLGV